MEGTNEVIAKLIIVGAVKLEGREPIFAKGFVSYITWAFAKNPRLDETAMGWREMFAGYNPSLGSLELRELGILSALVSYELAVQGKPSSSAE